jgi:hypothetical protein
MAVFPVVAYDPKLVDIAGKLKEQQALLDQIPVAIYCTEFATG